MRGSGNDYPSPYSSMTNAAKICPRRRHYCVLDQLTASVQSLSCQWRPGALRRSCPARRGQRRAGVGNGKPVGVRWRRQIQLSSSTAKLVAGGCFCLTRSRSRAVEAATAARPGGPTGRGNASARSWTDPPRDGFVRHDLLALDSRPYVAGPKTRAKILSTLRSCRSSEKASAICSGDMMARISGSASMAARKSLSSSQARMAWACTRR